MLHAFNTSTQEAKASRILWVQSHSGLQREFLGSQNTEKFSERKEKKRRKKRKDKKKEKRKKRYWHNSGFVTCCGIAPLYAVNMFYYHLSIKKLHWPIAWQDRTRWELKAEMQGEKGQSQKGCQWANRATRCTREQVHEHTWKNIDE